MGKPNVRSPQYRNRPYKLKTQVRPLKASKALLRPKKEQLASEWKHKRLFLDRRGCRKEDPFPVKQMILHTLSR